jgi:hypothetical protein
MFQPMSGHHQAYKYEILKKGVKVEVSAFYMEVDSYRVLQVCVSYATKGTQCLLFPIWE